MLDSEQRKLPFFLTSGNRSSNKFSNIQTDLRNTFNHPSRVNVNEVMLHAKKHAAHVLKLLQSDHNDFYQVESISNKSRKQNLMLTPEKTSGSSSSLIQYSPVGRTHYKIQSPLKEHNLYKDVGNLKTLLAQLLIALDGES